MTSCHLSTEADSLQGADHLTKGEQLDPIAHVYDFTFSLIHILKENIHRVVDIRLQVSQRFHGVCSADKPSLLAVDLLIAFCKQIELAMSLPDGIPIRPKFERTRLVHGNHNC